MSMKLLKYSVVLAVLSVPSAYVHGFEIPVDGVYGGSKSESGGGAIGYVDIEKIFREHPMTERLKKKFISEIENKRKEIADMEAVMCAMQDVYISTSTEIKGLENDVATLKNILEEEKAGPKMMLLPGTTEYVEMKKTPAQIAASTPTAVIPGLIAEKEKTIMAKKTDLEMMKKEVEDKRSEIDARVRQNKEELMLLEERQTGEILKDINEILEKLAEEEGITVILDKNNLLYGKTVKDLTDDVRERIRGR
ncbi:MAG: OmpH family outer membrane protein [Endomicrobiales bacterium]|nr:OmpH family outer membrane protein [Endomicrobiales bacterium]